MRGKTNAAAIREWLETQTERRTVAEVAEATGIHRRIVVVALSDMRRSGAVDAEGEPGAMRYARTADEVRPWGTVPPEEKRARKLASEERARRRRGIRPMEQFRAEEAARRQERERKRNDESAQQRAAREARNDRRRAARELERKSRELQALARKAEAAKPVKPAAPRPSSRRPLDQQPTTAPSFRQQIAAPEPLPSSFDWDGKIERIPAAWERRA